MKEFNFWQFMAGITVFVYAMMLIESSLKKLSGRTFKKFLQKHSQSKITMMGASTIVTAFLQSSSVVLLMILSFVGTGLLSMEGALAAALGANLGTTLDSWVIAIVGFKINFSSFSFPILAVALIGLISLKKETKLYSLTQFLIGFALIFIALEWLKSSADTSLEGTISNFKNWPALSFILFGFIITAIVQSSSVTVAITLTALYNHLIPFENAAAIVIGSEVGTTLKFLLGSLGGIPDKKRVAWANFILNFGTMIVASILLYPLSALIQNTFGIKDPLIGLVVFQTGINLMSIILFFPFLKTFAAFVEKLIKELKPEDLTRYIHNSTVALPADGIELATKEAIHMMNETIILNKEILGIDDVKKTGWINSFRQLALGSTNITETYEKIKILEGEILEYISQIPKTELSEKELEQTGRVINITRHILRSAKNLKDIRHNLDEFESTANDELFKQFSNMSDYARQFYQEFQDMIDKSDLIVSETISNLNNKNRKQYDDAIAILLIALGNKKISELDSSNLLNVYRELYSSNKALIRALADLKEIDADQE